MKELIVIAICWVIVGVISEILHIKYSDGPGYDVSNLTKVGLRCLTCWFVICKGFEYIIGGLLYCAVYVWKIIRIPIRLLGLICSSTSKNKDDIDEVEL